MKAGARFSLALLCCALGGWVIVPDRPARGILVGALSCIGTWWAVT